MSSRRRGCGGAGRGDVGELQQSEHPFVTFFAHTLRFVNAFGRTSVPRADDIDREWNRWTEAAQAHPYFDSDEGPDELQRYQKELACVLERGVTVRWTNPMQR